MSIQIMSAVLKHSKYRNEKLLVLIALADWANEQGVCWPSMPAIAEKARITQRGAIRIMQHFVAAGVIEVLDPGGGRGHSKRYRIKGEPGSGFEFLKKGDPESGFAAAKSDSESGKRVTVEARKGDPGDSAIRKNRQEPSGKEPPCASGDASSVARGVRERLALPADTLLYRVISDAVEDLMRRMKQSAEECAEFLIARADLWRASPDFATARGNRWLVFFRGQHYLDDPKVWNRGDGSNGRTSESERRMDAARAFLTQKGREREQAERDAAVGRDQCDS
jgi:hypothetical protein